MGHRCNKWGVGGGGGVLESVQRTTRGPEVKISETRVEHKYFQNKTGSSKK